MDFNEIRRYTLEKLEEIYTISVLDKTELAKLQKHEKYVEAWKIEDVLSIDDERRIDIKFYICFTYEFPLILPDIYLPFNIDEVKYIPHLDTNRKLCLFDNETIKVNPEDSLGIVRECLKTSKSIILNGITDQNNSLHFNEEFLAYWENTYHKNDEVAQYLSMLDNDGIDSTEVDILFFNSSVRGYKAIIHNNNDEANKLEEYLKRNGKVGSPVKGFYLGEVGEILPPFVISNIESVSFIQKHFPDLLQSFRKYLNDRSENAKIVLFSKVVNNRRLYFGWKYKHIETNIKGFRQGVLSKYNVITNQEKSKVVLRLSFDEYTSARIMNRTDKILSDNKAYKFLIAGIGSIGSNLIWFLNSLNVNGYMFIDPEVLTLENINRHLLGFDSMNMYKVDAIKAYIEGNNPLINCEVTKDSIIKVIDNKYELINNEIDFLFVAIGKYNIEEYIVEAVTTGKINKPVFIFWVEPYLLGGHIIYINPNSELTYSSLFPEHSFKYNIISNSEYKKDENKLRFKEAGCQTSYVPYGKESIMLFLSQSIKYISELIKSKDNHNIVITWIGNKDFGIKLNIEVSDFAKAYSYGDIVINKL